MNDSDPGAGNLCFAVNNVPLVKNNEGQASFSPGD